MSETRTWCWPLLHDWAKWGELMRGKRKVVANIETPSLRTEEEFPFTYQQRECQRCGQIQVRTL